MEDNVCHPTALLATLLLCLLFPFPTQAQESDFIPDEDMLEADDDAFDPQEVLERLEALRRHPLDPNRASFSQLQQIPYLSASQIRGILDRRKKDKFERLADLLQAEGMDPGTLARTRPFLRIRPVRRNRSHLRSRGAITLPLARGFGEGHYWGDPFKIYLRLNLS
ncbi:helix-hairpin-helix domain-containing protein, partial [bacterium]|nr:helix-hairpin-helix domain-containing protein [bacterium]